MDNATRFVNTSASVCCQMNAEIQVRQNIKCRDSIQEMPSFCCVHTTENSIAFRNFKHRYRIVEIHFKREYLSSESQAFNGLSEHLNLPSPAVTWLCIYNSLPIPSLN